MCNIRISSASNTKAMPAAMLRRCKSPAARSCTEQVSTRHWIRQQDAESQPTHQLHVGVVQLIDQHDEPARLVPRLQGYR